jgi:hypothetical protein
VKDEQDYVSDETWVKPEVEERAEGFVDWKALEENYLLAEQRFMGFGANKKPGGGNREEDLRMQMDLIADAEKKKEKQQTAKVSQKTKTTIRPTEADTKHDNQEPIVGDQYHFLPPKPAYNGIEGYQALLHGLEEESKARLRKRREEQDELVREARRRRKSAKSKEREGCLNGCEDMNQILHLPQGEEKEKAGMELGEERRENLDAIVSLSTAYQKLLKDRPKESGKE